MNLITWNLQWGRGIDDRVDLARIVKTARAMSDFDVFCVQEIADNFPGLGGNDDRDQFAELSSLLPGYGVVTAPAVDVAADGVRRRRFGVAIYSRYPVISSRAHALPWPADPGKKSMPRTAAEATLETPMGALRVTTTHLEYYSELQRYAQAARLRDLHDEACDRATRPMARIREGGPFDATAQTQAAILTGDFNCTTDSLAYAEIMRGMSPYVDAWKVANGDTPHVPTFCVHDRRYSKTPYCCDFIFVSDNAASRVKAVSVDSSTADSDHQPVLLAFDDS
jgi:endonuclease/exonuclease/phosphatase family metal-dependent hydrolase